MGNDIGCEVCSSYDIAYENLELRTKSEKKPISKIPIRIIDSYVDPNKLRNLSVISPEIMYITKNTNNISQSIDPDIESNFQEISNKQGIYRGGLLREKYRNGIGIQTYDYLNEKYLGQWRDDLREGRGVLVQSDDSIYVGEWAQNSPNGQGVYLGQENTIYTGKWVNGKLTGICLFQSEICVYEGGFQNGVKKGCGRQTWNDASQYEGEWDNDEMTGFGVLKYSSGVTYEGEFKNGFKCGIGKLFYKDQNDQQCVHIGEFRNDQKNGFGIERQGQNSIEGIWLDGEIEGLATVNGDAYFYQEGQQIKKFKQNRVQSFFPEDWVDPYKFVEAKLQSQKSQFNAQFDSKISSLSELLKNEIAYLLNQQSAYQELLRQKNQ